MTASERIYVNAWFQSLIDDHQHIAEQHMHQQIVEMLLRETVIYLAWYADRAPSMAMEPEDLVREFIQGLVRHIHLRVAGTASVRQNISG